MPATPEAQGLLKLTWRHWAILAAILLAGAALRWAYLRENVRSPGFALPAVDAGFHDYWARAMLSGDWTPPHDFADPKITSSPYFRPPGYPYLLAGIYAVSGGSYMAPRVFQLLLGLLVCLEASWLGRRIFSPPVGLVWAGLVASYWGFVYWEGELHAEMPLVAVLLAWLWVCLKLRRRLSWPWGLACGVLLGLATLLRPNVLVLAPLSVLWLWWVARRRIEPVWAGAGGHAATGAARRPSLWSRAFKPAIALAAGTVLTIAPATIRNAAVGNDLVLLSSNGGINLYIGNCAAANGLCLGEIPSLGEFGTCFDEPLLMENLQRKLGRPLKPSEASAWYSQQARTWIADHPGRFVELLGIKTALFWGPYEVAHNKEDHYERLNSPVLRSLPLDFSIVLALFLAGTAMLAARWRRTRMGRRDGGAGRDEPQAGARVIGSAQTEMVALMLAAILAYFLSVLPFFIAGRYRIVIVPLLMGPAAWAVVEIVALFRRRWRQPALWMSVFLIVPAAALLEHGLLYWLAGVKYRPSEVKWHYDRGSCYNQLDKLDEAEREFSLAVQADRDHAPSQMDLGLVLARQRKYAQAAQHLARSIQLRGSAKDHLNYALVLTHLNKLPLAVEHLERAAQLAERVFIVRYKVAHVLMENDRLGQALPHLAAAAALSPDPGVRLELAALLQITDQPTEAIKLYRQMLKERPEWPQAMNDLAWLLATCPRAEFGDPGEALALAERACRLSENKQWLWLDTLAAAQAATGDFAKAVQTAQKALQLAQQAGQQQAGELQARLELYKAGKAFIDAPASRPATQPGN